MTAQSTFVLPTSDDGQRDPAPPPPNPAPQTPLNADQQATPPRVFWYEGTPYEDVPGWSIDQVREALAVSFPALTNATWTEDLQEDGTMRIEFVKVTGEKGQQIAFFDDPLPPSPSFFPNDATSGQRVYIVDGQLFTLGEGSGATIQQVRDHFALSYPELVNATWSVRKLPDGTEEVTFHKVAGEKGTTDLDTSAQLMRQIVGCIRQASPANLEAIALTHQLIQIEHSPPTPLGIDQVLQLGPRIQQALLQLDAFEAHHKRSLEACLRLQAMPLPRVPLGF